MNVVHFEFGVIAAEKKEADRKKAKQDGDKDTEAEYENYHNWEK